MIKRILSLIKLLITLSPLQVILKIILQISLGLLGSMGILFLQNAIDAIGGFIKNENNGYIAQIWCGVYVVSLLVVAVGNNYINHTLNISLKRKLNDKMASTIIDKLKKIDYAYYESKRFHDTLARMSDAPEEQLFSLFSDLCEIGASFAGVLGLAVIFFQANALFVISFVILFTPTVFLMFRIEDILEEMYDDQTPDERELGYLSELMANKDSLTEFKVFQAFQYIAKKWNAKADIVTEERRKTVKRAEMYAFLSSALLQLWTISTIVALVMLAINGILTFGTLVALAASTEAMIATAGEFSLFARELRANLNILKHYFKFMKLPNMPFEKSVAIYNKPSFSTIEFKDVFFKYPEFDDEGNVITNSDESHAVYVLNGFNATFHTQKHTAIVGTNGSGKSTIVKLLLGLYQPNKGEILVDGRNISSIPREELRKSFSVLFQDYGKYQFSVRENVALHNTSKMDCDLAIKQALRESESDSKLSENLDMPLGKLAAEGIGLSGGEWQKIALARSFFEQRDASQNEKFVIWDEPTASLDAIAESKLYDGLLKRLDGSGGIIISHRLASTRLADEIIVLEDGKTIEMGGFDALLAADDHFAKMFESQREWYG
ncbi:MAG: ABC transporter ATP-binding protein/permease [Lachnospiraceae bacterium]|nr:ABC transporter ATP-binding protein/permease [Lachnospiraceae bacterium]